MFSIKGVKIVRVLRCSSMSGNTPVNQQVTVVKSIFLVVKYHQPAAADGSEILQYMEVKLPTSTTQ